MTPELPTIEYDREADAAYVQLRNLPYTVGKDLDDDRRIDYAADGSPIGVELLNVSLGVKIKGLPEGDQIALLLRREGITTRSTDK
jgi:uncharacterized protein YuzE